jgi:hypothetical protein
MVMVRIDKAAGGGRHGRGKWTLPRPGSEEHGLIDGRAAQRRGRGETDQSHDKDSPAAPEVGRATAEGQ